MTSEPDSAPRPSEAPGAPASVPAADGPHDFEVQKEIHQRIRNDPDYDDWEYGTEPLPHEAWVKSRPLSPPAAGEAAAAG